MRSTRSSTRSAAHPWRRTGQASSVTVQAGGVPIGWVSLACELQRDWGRQETVPEIIEIVLTERLLKE